MVYPQIDLNADYCIDDDKKISGKEIDKKGLILNLFDNYKMKHMRLKKQVQT